MTSSQVQKNQFSFYIVVFAHFQVFSMKFMVLNRCTMALRMRFLSFIKHFAGRSPKPAKSRRSYRPILRLRNRVSLPERVLNKPKTKIVMLM